MQLIEHYHRMSTELAADRQEMPVTLKQLADILYCSPRNVKLLLKKMADSGWIVWSPGRGRGNRSQLTFLADSGDLIVEEAKRHAAGGNVKASLQLVNLPGVQERCRERFFEWLAGHFGYREIEEREKRLDTLRLPFYEPILTLDPAEVLFAKDLHLIKQIFDTLVRFDPAERAIKPHLAHYWEESGGGTRWTLYLRKGVRFHHGREATAADAAYSLLRLKERERSATNGWLAGPIRSVRALDRYVLEIELNAANYMFLHYLSAAGMSVLPEDVYGRQDADVARYPVGTGAFRVARHDDCVCVLEAFPDYFRERAHLDRVEIWMMPSECRPSGDRFLVAGEGCGRPLPLAAGYPDWKEIERVEQGCTFLAFNLTKAGPQRHRNFRLAVHHLIDRRGLSAAMGDLKAYPAQGFLPPETPILCDPDHDPQEAARLLGEMGYGGEPLHMYLKDKHREKGEWIAQQCAKAGISVRVTALPHHEAYKAANLREADCVLSGVVADEDTDLSLLEMYQIGNMPIRIYFGPELEQEIDRRIAAIVREPSESERPARIRELEQVLKQDGCVLFLLHHRLRTAYSPAVNGVSLNSLGFVNFKDLWFG